MKDGGKADIHKRAYALKYNPSSDPAPKVVASGRGYLAEKILDKAREHNIPTHYDPALAEELSKVDVGDNIPPELYEVVAQILVFIGNLDRYKLEEQAAKNASAKR
ncbi:MAG: EscU/YscU/HrcU family type III secretion system export apparatus switch protein [Defluviitaleaceae bacterium]|nr:EscU/YscU/HrcU family type III secretion system export apparatus switch protein [Defluviitaleaceae bacterium]